MRNFLSKNFIALMRIKIVLVDYITFCSIELTYFNFIKEHNYFKLFFTKYEIYAKLN